MQKTKKDYGNDEPKKMTNLQKTDKKACSLFVKGKQKSKNIN